MTDSLAPGIAVVLLAGIFQGSFLLPSKWMKGWAWENYWFIFAVTAYLVSPWIVAAATVPHLLEVYRGASPRALGALAVFGCGWGLGALTFGLGVDAIGLALGFAIILGVAATSGTLVPLLVGPGPQFSAGWMGLTALGLLLMLAGVVACSWAGKWKESGSPGGRPYRVGVLICVASGLLSACGNLGFAFGTEIAARARDLGAAEHLAGNALWSLLALPLFFCNAGYALILLRRNGSSACFHTPGSGRRGLLAVLMGALWMAGMALYGVGARKLGTLGPSLGWALLMSSMVLVSNMLGVLTGEWKASPAAAKRKLASGIAILIAAVALLGGANYLSK